MIASDDAEYIYGFPYTDVAAVLHAVMGARAGNSSESNMQARVAQIQCSGVWS